MFPDVSHYYGRTVEKVETTEGDGEWAIVLEGNVRIENLDPLREAPEDSLVGMKFSKAAMEVSQTRLFFGTDDNPLGTVMFLTPTEYGISEPNFHGGELFRPQDAEAEARFSATPEDEPSAPGDRVVDGPEAPAAAEEGQD